MIKYIFSSDTGGKEEPTDKDTETLWIGEKEDRVFIHGS